MPILFYNGAIALTNTGAAVDFFPTNNAQIEQVNTPIDPLGPDVVIDAVFLDHDRYYVVADGTLFSMSLADVRNPQSVASLLDADISKIDAVYFSADEFTLYIGIVDGATTKIQTLDKRAQVATDWPSLLYFKASGLAVDAGHIYLGDSLINKSSIKAYALTGELITQVELDPAINLGSLSISGSELYFINKNDSTIHQATLSWTP
jgi:hypothetical protein